MPDRFTPQQRSRVMGSVRARGNRATELKLIGIFRKAGITGWRRHPRLLGNPDFIFRRERLVIFVDGCFWHGCRRHLRLPQTHRAYWARKIARNAARDAANTRALAASGWRVVRIWEHSLRAPEPVVRRVQSLLKSA